MPQRGADLEHLCGCHKLLTPGGESAGPRWGEQPYLTSAQSSLQHRACNTQLVMKDRDVIWPGWWYLPRVCMGQAAPGCSTGTSHSSPITQLPARQRFYAQQLFFSEGCNQEGTEVTCSSPHLPAELLFVCCDSLVPNPAGSQMEKTVLLPNKQLLLGLQHL